MPTRPTCLTCQVEIAKICNQFVGFRLCWVCGRLEFSQLASGGLDRNISSRLHKNIGLYLPNPSHAHPYPPPFYMCVYLSMII